MNKNVLMVLAVIIALLAGWLLLSVAVQQPVEEEEEVSGSGVTAIHAPEVTTPSATDISVTVVEELEAPSTDVTVEVVQ